MRKRFSDVKNSTLSTADGVGLRPVGKVIDLLIDHETWNVRYLVVSTDVTLTRRVLISPVAIQGFDVDKKSIATILTAKQVTESPPIERDQPISRKYEQTLVDYYGWPNYWDGRSVLKPQVSKSAASGEVSDSIRNTKFFTLRSANELCSYKIQSENGPAGMMRDLVIQMDSWTVDYATAESSSWLPKESSMFSTSRILQVDRSSKSVTVDLTKASLSPASAKNGRPVIIGEPFSSQPFRTT